MLSEEDVMELQETLRKLRKRLEDAVDVMVETGRVPDTPAARACWVSGKRRADPKGHWLQA